MLDDAFDTIQLSGDTRKLANTALILIFSLGLGLCSLPIIGELISYCCKCYCLGRCIIKISWFISGVIGTVLLISGGAIMAVLLTTKDFCRLLDDTITDQAFLDKYFDLGDEVKFYLSPCLYGSGDFATLLGITT